MSAIGGVVRLGGGQVEPAVLNRMAAALQPLGRDAQHILSQDMAGFVHTLLRVTPEDHFDRQPLHSRHANLILLFDGRIDNREELADRLGLSPCKVKVMADSAMVLKVFERWGERGVEFLLGDFALALWQPLIRTLLLARDPLGMRPLYWYQRPGLFAFATRCNGLFVLPGLSCQICEKRLAEYLALLPEEGAESFYQDIYRVEPGQLLRLHDGKLHSHYYHRFDPEKRIVLASDDEYLDAFREQVERAVRVRLRTRGGIGSQLSGGFDSATVTAVAARLLAEQGQGMSAYTAVPREGYDGPVPKGRIADEGPAASALAARFDNIDHLLVRAADRSPLSGIVERMEKLGRVPRNVLNLIWNDAILKLVEERGERVLLVAQKGNQSISYNGRSQLHILLQQGDWTEWWREAVALRHRRPDVRWPWLLKESLAPFMSQRMWRQVSRLFMKTTVSLWDYSMISSPFALRSGVGAMREFGSRPSISGRQRRINMFYQHDLGDHYAAANSLSNVEMRDPTTDTRLVEFCLAIPEGQYLHHGIDRWLVRRMMVDNFPPETLNEQRKGLQSADWHEGVEAALPEIRRFLKELRDSGRANDYLDFARMEQLLLRWPERAWAKPDGAVSYFALFRGLAAAAFIRDVVEART